MSDEELSSLDRVAMRLRRVPANDLVTLFNDTFRPRLNTVSWSSDRLLPDQERDLEKFRDSFLNDHGWTRNEFLQELDMIRLQRRRNHV